MCCARKKVSGVKTQSFTLSITVGHGRSRQDWNRKACFVETLSAVEITEVPSGSLTKSILAIVFQEFQLDSSATAFEHDTCLSGCCNHHVVE